MKARFKVTSLGTGRAISLVGVDEDIRGSLNLIVEKPSDQEKLKQGTIVIVTIEPSGT